MRKRYISVEFLQKVLNTGLIKNYKAFNTSKGSFEIINAIHTNGVEFQIVRINGEIQSQML